MRMYWHYPFGATSRESICSYARNNQPELIQQDTFQEIQFEILLLADSDVDELT